MDYGVWDVVGIRWSSVEGVGGSVVWVSCIVDECILSGDSVWIASAKVKWSGWAMFWTTRNSFVWPAIHYEGMSTWLDEYSENFLGFYEELSPCVSKSCEVKFVLNLFWANGWSGWGGSSGSSLRVLPLTALPRACESESGGGDIGGGAADSSGWNLTQKRKGEPRTGWTRHLWYFFLPFSWYLFCTIYDTHSAYSDTHSALYMILIIPNCFMYDTYSVSRLAGSWVAFKNETRSGLVWEPESRKWIEYDMEYGIWNIKWDVSCCTSMCSDVTFGS